MEDYSMVLAELMTMGGFLAIYGMTLAFIFAVCAFILLFYAALFLATRIPYYKMAKRAGLPKAWLIWVPIAEMYILFKLPKREFNLFDKFKTNDRELVFWWWLILIGAMPAISAVLYTMMMVPILNVIVAIVYYAIMAIYMVVVYIISWRIFYDILMTYGMQEHAMWAAIANCFCPIVMIVFSYMIMNKEPDYTV